MFLVGWMIMVAAGQSWAQQACPAYDRLIGEARTCVKNHRYDSALLKFNSARQCNPAKGAEIAKMIQDMMLSSKETADLQKANTAPAQLPVGPGESEKTRTNTGSASSTPAVNRTGTIDSLRAFLRFLKDAKNYDSTYWHLARENMKVTAATSFSADGTAPLKLYSHRLMDYIYFASLLDLDFAMKMLPANSTTKYQSQVRFIHKELESRRRSSLQGFRMPDTLKGLPGSVLYARHNADNRNFAWGYSDYGDYKKLQVRYLNMSLPDFSITTDSVQLLADSGIFYTVPAAAGDYKYVVGREIDYSLKPNKVEYRRIVYADSAVKRLMDSSGRLLMDLSGYSSNGFFFSPDGSHLAGWNDGSELLLTDVGNKVRVSLPHSKPAPTESFSSDSRKIAYYNEVTRVIYVVDMAGKVLEEIPGRLTGIDSISNIDFTGGDRYLKINNDDSITLFDLGGQRVVMRLNKALVNDVVISPDGRSVLLTCHAGYSVGTEDYKTTIGIVTDTALNVKARLYSDCSSFFFTPNGDYIIGYGQYSIMRWAVGGSPSAPAMESCLSIEEMVKTKCLPLDRWAKVTDADLMETGARAFKDLADDETDAKVKHLYYKLSAALFYELAVGNTRNTRWERTPFYYDWYNWEERNMGNRDFGNQFVREITAVKTFDGYLNSPDSVYPQQLYFAAYGNLLLENLYDSMGIFNRDFIELAIKEIALRCRVFTKDAENLTNTEYLIKAFRRLSAVCDTVGWRDLQNGHYPQRLAIYASEERLLAENFKALPDTFGLKSIYIDALAQLAASFLYSYASHPGGMGRALDSALSYAEKGLALSPGKFDSARLLIVEARAYLLAPGVGGLEKSMGLYRQVRRHFPNFSPETMLNQLVFLREAGAKKTVAMERVEEFLKAEGK